MQSETFDGLRWEEEAEGGARVLYLKSSAIEVSSIYTTMLMRKVRAIEGKCGRGEQMTLGNHGANKAEIISSGNRRT